MFSDKKKGARYALLALLPLLMVLIGIRGLFPPRAPGTGSGAVPRVETPAASAAPAAVAKRGGDRTVPPASRVTASSPTASPPAPGSEPASSALAPAVLSGKVLDRETREPVEGVHVFCLRSRWQENQKLESKFEVAETDQQGRYRLELHPEDFPGEGAWRYGLEILPPGGMMREVTPQGMVRQVTDREMEASETEWREGTFPPLEPGAHRVQDLLYDPGYTLVVEVLATDCRPVKGILYLERGQAGGIDFSGLGIGISDGHAERKDIDPQVFPLDSTTFRLELQEHLAPPSSRLSDHLLVKRRIEVRVMVSPGGVIEGLVTYPDGRPCKAGKVLCYLARLSHKEQASAFRESELRPDGTFRVGWLPPEEKGGFFLSVLSVPDACMPHPLKVACGERVHIVLDAGAVISGRVVDAQGAPVPGVRVMAYSGERWESRDAQTDPQGRFALKALPPGKVNLLIMPVDCEMRSWDPPLAICRLPDGREVEVPLSGRQGVPVGTGDLEIVLTPEVGMRPYPP